MSFELRFTGFSPLPVIRGIARVQIEDGLGRPLNDDSRARIQDPEALAPDFTEIALNQNRLLAPRIVGVDINLGFIGGKLVTLIMKKLHIPPEP